MVLLCRGASLGRRPLLNTLLFAILLSGLGACTKTPEAPLTEAQKLYSHGKAVYQANCITCHNVDPHLAGAVGPDLFGSSSALITARVLHTAYPPGYTPKRKTGAMPQFPYLEKDIPALEAFLNNKQ